MHIHELFEKRYIKPALIDKLREVSQNENFFVTFTEINKVGINPTTLWSDPLGVYAYPLKDIFPLLEELRCPFGANRPYCHLLEARSSICDLQELSMDDVIIKFKNMSNLLIDLDFSNTSITDPIKYWEAMFTNVTRIKTPDDAFWEGTRKLSNLIAKTDETKSIPVTWNKILRSVGCNIIVDRNSIISANEPEQAVFLHPSSYSVNNTFINDIFKL